MNCTILRMPLMTSISKYQFCFDLKQRTRAAEQIYISRKEKDLIGRLNKKLQMMACDDVTQYDTQALRRILTRYQIPFDEELAKQLIQWKKNA